MLGRASGNRALRLTDNFGLRNGMRAVRTSWPGVRGQWQWQQTCCLICCELVRLTGATFFDVVGKAPWVAEQPSRDIVLPKILRGSEHLIAYHVVTEGCCYGSLVDGPPIAVEAGEVIVFAHGDPHVMSSGPGMRADPFVPEKLDAMVAEGLPFFASYGGEARRQRGWSVASLPAMPARSIRFSRVCRASSKPATPRRRTQAGSASSSVSRSWNRRTSGREAKASSPS